MAIPLDDDEQHAVISGLAALVEQFGAADLLHRPLLLPTPEFFPDAWRPDVEGARVMLMRLLAWARLGDARFELRAADADDLDAPLAVFLGRDDDGVLHFEVNPSLIEHADVLAGALLRAVAEAWCTTKLNSYDDVEVDFAMAFLGGAVLATNAALISRVTLDSLAFRTTISAQGVLIPAASVFLLAVVLRARDLDGEYERVVPHLERRQRECLVDLWPDLLPGETYRRWLGIVAFGQAPVAPALPSVVKQLAQVEAVPQPRGWAVRARRRRFAAGTLGGLAVGALLGGYGVGAIIACTVIGAVAGARSTWDQCSACQSLLRQGESHCAVCHALIVGELVSGQPKIEPRFAEEVVRLDAARAEAEASLERIATETTETTETQTG